MTAAAETAPGPQVHRRYPAATTIAMPCPIRRGMIPRPARIPGHDAIALMHDYKTDAIRRDTGCREVAIRQALKIPIPFPTILNGIFYNELPDRSASHPFPLTSVFAPLKGLLGVLTTECGAFRPQSPCEIRLSLI
jgi:hypothetical protein